MTAKIELEIGTCGGLSRGLIILLSIASLAEAQGKLDPLPPIQQPREYLRPFVEFLHRESADPQAFLLGALARHQVVILGEVHNRPRYWAFNASLVREPTFAKRTGVIYMELPSNDQALVEQFLAASRYDPQPIIETLRDMMWMGWPDQGMLDFFKAVWEANQGLPKQQRLRIVLVDMKRPWKQIAKPADWEKYKVDRDQFMAESVLRDLREHSPEPRHAFFIVGYGHAMVDLSSHSGEPIKKAGWHLREKLDKTNVFAVFPHSPVMSNLGEVAGRIAAGLFETAFAALTNRPMAFPLDRGPFGECLFDASLDVVTTNAFRAAFDAYLYLGPLENETRSSLVPGFYTDEFVQELDRRCRLECGQGLMAAYHLPKVDAENFVGWLSTTGGWGRSRGAWSAVMLGPMDEWQRGSGSDQRLGKESVPRAAWAFVGQSTPEASLQSMLWATRTGNLDAFVACFPPDNKPSATEFDDVKSQVESVLAFSILGKETNSSSEATLNVLLQMGSQQLRSGFIMKAVEGKWRFAGKVDQ